MCDLKSILRVVLLLTVGLAVPAVGAASADAQSPTEAARGLVERLLPKQAKCFVLETIPRDPAGDVFEIESRDGSIVLRGNNGVSIASALNWYLKYRCGCHYSFTGGSQLQLPEPLPQVVPRVRQVSAARYRYFLNYCAFGYSLPWYDWPQWERLIDWMALNGINLPLSITGQEAVWQAVGRRMGWGEQDVRAFLAGPPYLPFGWMGCLDGHGGPLPQSWIDRHIELERKILQRERALGMTPVLQGFTGHVPAGITNQAPTARLQKIHWIEWDTFLLDPLDPLFARIAKVFIEEQTSLFGTDHYYAADTFIEMIPPSGETGYLSGVSRAIFDGMKAADPQAVWVLQSWPFFYAQHFWTQPRIEAVLGSIPDERMLLLDLYCEKTPLWSRTKAFCGKPWLWCNIQNFGDRVWLGGPLDLINRDVFAARRDPDAGRLSGLGFVNEGLDNNPVVFDLMFELAWRDEPVPLDSWLRDYARRSYGKPNPEAEQAWRTLYSTVYQDAFDNRAACTAVPSLAAPPVVAYDNQRLAVAWKQMLTAADDLRGSDAFQFDLVNLTRQVLANQSAQYHREAIRAFQQKDRAALGRASAKMLGLIRDLDELLATRREFLLGRWLDSARQWGTNADERDLMEWNARRVLTLWGNSPAIRDYSCRQWSGLLSGFYLERWELFCRRMDEALAAGKPFDEQAVAAEVIDFEKSWSSRHERYPREPHGDSIGISRRLWEKYGALDSRPECPSLTTAKPASCSAALPGHPAYLANDGQSTDTDAYWAADVTGQFEPAWWQVDLEREATVGRVVVVGYYGDHRSYGFTVELSQDGQAWVLVADQRDNREPSVKSGYSCRFEPRPTRFIRITQTGNSANSGRHLVEVMAFDQ